MTENDLALRDDIHNKLNFTNTTNRVLSLIIPVFTISIFYQLKENQIKSFQYDLKVG